MGTLKLPKTGSAQMVVCERSLEASQRLSPRTSPPLSPQLSLGALPGFSSITLESQCPHLTCHWVPRAQVRHGSWESWEDSPAGFGVLCPRLSLGSEISHWKLGGWFSPNQDPQFLQLPKHWKRLSAEELMLSDCGAGEDSFFLKINLFIFSSV